VGKRDPNDPQQGRRDRAYQKLKGKTRGTLRSQIVQTKLEGIADQARRYPDRVFTTLYYQIDEASRTAFYEGMHGNAIQHWEDQRMALDTPGVNAVREAEQNIQAILKDITSIAAEITANEMVLNQLSEGQVQLLTALKRTINRGREPNRNNLVQFGKEHFYRFLVNWDDAFEQLNDKGLLKEANGSYSLTSTGRIYANIVNKERPVWLYLYNELYIRAEKSQAYTAFCQRVYGKDLCQQGQADIEQIHTLLDILKIGPTSRVLDLGCGNGMITEYISERTQAHITGVDIANEAIKRAQTRTESKRGRLTFQTGNVNSLDVFSNLFDTIIAIDTFHITVDLYNALRQSIISLKPGGQMGIFWESWVRGGTSERYLQHDNTRLAQTLKKLGLVYNIVDFTDANNYLWQEARCVLIAFGFTQIKNLFAQRLEKLRYI
jgi:ubiquinone/menaquinone biosynthesis C-methylase UbiE